MNSLKRDLVEGETLYLGDRKFVPRGGFGMLHATRGSAVFGELEGRGLERVCGMDLSEAPQTRKTETAP